MKKIIILGSTGSIGKQALAIAREKKESYQIVALTCRKSINDLRNQIREFNPKAVCVFFEEDAIELKKEFKKLDVFFGEDGLKEIVKIEADIVLSALIGISGLAPTYSAIANGKDIALANKETLVAGGNLVMAEAKKSQIKLLPVDSEHSAIFQCLEANIGSKTKNIYLTASGGPFKDLTIDEMKTVNIKDALNHPNWNMGKKITIDSATMMNKGFEVIEASHLFNISGEQIKILIHKESIVHSAVEFCDNSIIAQMGVPDMKIPIGLAFSYPKREELNVERLDFFKEGRNLHFEKPRPDIFTNIELAYNSLKEKGSMGAFLNGANEKLVELFLDGKIAFLDIQETLYKLCERYKSFEPHSIEEILEVDKEARAKVIEELNYKEF